MEKADRGLDRFGPAELPPNICLEDVRAAKEKQRETKERAREKRKSSDSAQENMLRKERKNIIAKVEDAIKYDYGSFTVTPHADLGMDKRLELIKELMDRFNGQVYGVRAKRNTVVYSPDYELEEEDNQRLERLDALFTDVKPYKSFTVYL